MKQIIINVFVLTCFMFIQTRQVTAQSVTIDLNTEYQTVSGFGGIQIPAWTGTDLNEDIAEKAFGNDPGKIGLSILRLRIDPDSNLFYRELPFAKYAVEKGAIVFASPWNPPEEMLDPGVEYRRLLEDYYDDYVEHLNRYNQFMADSGVSLYAVSIQNEPDIEDNWTEWTPEEMVTFMRENAQNINTRVIAPESFHFDHSYSDTILNDSTANAHLDIVGGHIYGSGLENYPLAHDKGKEVWMTEHYTSSDRSANLWPDALLVGSEIDSCMKVNFNAYVWWYIRRFYGLITDDGAISKRGYVMSHFSKFVRPGAVRVDGSVSSAPDIDVTAYKTDSSVAIIVINQNDVSVNLDFTIQNGIVDTLTQYTTSAIKNMVNDGGISVSGGIFNATVDASSITTFSSYTGYAGKYGNVAPVADAGSDIEVSDTNGNGSEIIILDGTGSNDPDGALINYSWSVDGIQVAWDSVYELTIDIGEHEVILTVTDDDGATNTDTINLLVNSIYHTEFWFEAECAQVGSTWEINTDTDASNGKYVNTPAGTESTDNASSDTANHIIFTFHVSEAGPYKAWGRVITPSANDDSYWVRMDDDTTWALWNSIPGGADWHWEEIFDQSNESQVVVYALDTGYHSLSVCLREDGALLDKVYLTNTGAVPEGIGEADSTCPEEPGPEYTVNTPYENAEIILYPNPANHMVQVSWSNGYTNLMIVGMDGKTILEKEYAVPRKNTHLELNLKPGMYFVFLKNEINTGVSKLIIR